MADLQKNSLECLLEDKNCTIPLVVKNKGTPNYLVVMHCVCESSIKIIQKSKGFTS